MKRSDKVITDPVLRESVGKALGRIPSGLFILTARHEDHATGILASWVQQVSFEPPLVSVAVAKGRAIMPLISESRAFGLCQLPKDDKILIRKFSGSLDSKDDPFLGFDLVPDTYADVPILTHSMSYLECEVRTHIDVDGDHDIFVGTVKSGGFLQGDPWVHLRENGFKY